MPNYIVPTYNMIHIIYYLSQKLIEVLILLNIQMF